MTPEERTAAIPRLILDARAARTMLELRDLVAWTIVRHVPIAEVWLSGMPGLEMVEVWLSDMLGGPRAIRTVVMCGRIFNARVVAEDRP